MDERLARQAHRAPCRGCRQPTLGSFSGWVTDTGVENSIRPRAYYRQCQQCGLVRMVLGGDRAVTDAEGLARMVLDEHLRKLGGAATATSTPDGPPPLDWERCLWYLVDLIWRLYADTWDPAVGVPFTAYAMGIARQRLHTWIRDESGEASGRSKGRVHPKAHSSSVSTSLDAIYERAGGEDRASLGAGDDDHGGLAEADPFGARDLADDCSPDLAWALTARGRTHARP